MADALLVALVALNSALGLYLVWLFSRIRTSLARSRVHPERDPSSGQALDELAADLERVADSVAQSVAAIAARVEALENKIADRAGAPEPTSGPASHAQPDSAAATAFGERHAKVLRLRHAGMSPAEIARAEGMSEGEVELVIGLRERLSPRPAEPPD